MANEYHFHPPKTSRQPVSCQHIGKVAEQCARRLLEDAGLRWIASNVRFPGGELDLVMRENQTIVFIEVRYRLHPSFGNGAATVDKRKQQKLIRCAYRWLADNPQLNDQPCRFDVVHANGSPPCIEWIRHAFTADR